MRITLFQNKRNSHKFIEVKHTNDRHYMWRQYLEFENGVRNNLSAFHRMRKNSILEVVNSDYIQIVK